MKKIYTSILLCFFSFYLSAQNFNLEFRGEIVYPYSVASIWGYVKDSSEYALVGTDLGVSIVDVTDPDNPNDLFDVVHAGASGEWREIKTYDHYAYATNETGNGILIVDLQYLPDSVKQYQFIYDPPVGQTQTTGHTLWIDEKGRLFVFGGNYSSGYACFDLTVDELNPPFLGNYSDNYIHDGFVRGDTLWASEVYNGDEEVLDVSDPANPVSMAVFSTPNHFTHNAWPTSDNHYLFTTDEVNDSYLTSYDVSDLGNITELDKEQSNPGSNAIIHNVHLYNDQFAYTAYYKDGVVLFDVSHPDNMIEVAHYDTDPGQSGGDYGGTWGVYPYLPSGNIIASDLSYFSSAAEDKLTILTPTYVSACWLEGLITDSTTGAAINNATVQIVSTQNSDLSDLSGNYKTGNGIPGTYSVQYIKAGYETKTISVTLNSGELTTQDVQLVPLVYFPYTGQVVDALSGDPIASANVLFDGGTNGTFSSTTDANGNFSFTSIFNGSYNAYAGKWGHRTNAILNDNINENSSPTTIYLYPGYYDDFLFNFNWVPSGGNSGTGKWVRAEPIGTSDDAGQYNPDLDVSTDYGVNCFVTGNGAGDPSTYDVDKDVVKLTSPVFDLTTYTEPYLNFYAWFVDAGPFIGTPDDTLHFTLSNGSTTVPILDLTKNDAEATWKFHSFKVSDYITPTNNMTLKLSTVDFQGTANWIEGGLDQFEVVDSLATGVASLNPDENNVTIYPNPFNDQTIIKFDFRKLEFKSGSVSIYNSVGQLLQVFPILDQQGTLYWGNDFPDGVYFISISVNGEMKKMIPVVKNK